MKSRLTVSALVIVAVLLGAISVSAQGVSGGIKGGALFSSIPKFSDTFDGSGVDVGQRIGFTGGAFLTISLLPGFAIQPEVLFVQKGAKVTSGDGDFDLRVSLDYIDVPVLARLSFGAGGARAYVFGGPSFNFNMKAESEIDSETEDLGDQVEKYELSVVAGLGVEIGKFLVEGRWIEGLKNISTEPDEEIMNRTFAIMAGIRF